MTSTIDKTATVYDMRTEDMRDPVGLDDPTPTFSWKTASNTRGWAQSAYRLLVTENDRTVWDSGKIENSTSVGIFYQGEPLKESTEYCWQVTLWNHKGEYVTSPKAFFEMGLMGTASFSDAAFITYPDHVRSPLQSTSSEAEAKGLPVYRKAFTFMST